MCFLCVHDVFWGVLCVWAKLPEIKLDDEQLIMFHLDPSGTETIPHTARLINYPVSLAVCQVYHMCKVQLLKLVLKQMLFNSHKHKCHNKLYICATLTYSRDRDKIRV